MGMYDTIVCKHKLPMPENPQGYSGSFDFQTKDFHNSLDTYEILENGSLWIQCSEQEYKPGNPKGKTFSEKFGHLIVKKSWFEQVKITKEICMYDFQQKNESNYDYSIEYLINFENGFVKDIKLNKFETIDNTSRKEFEKKIWDENKKRQIFENRFYYKYGIKYWNRFIRNLFKFLGETFSFLARKMYKYERIFFI